MKIETFVVVDWPESQDLMGYDWFTTECHLINDNRGLDQYGSSAYFVPTQRYEEHLRTVMPMPRPVSHKPYYITSARLTNLPQMRIKSAIPGSIDAALWADSEEAA